MAWRALAAVAALQWCVGCDGAPGEPADACFRLAPTSSCAEGAGVAGRLLDVDGKPRVGADVVGCSTTVCLVTKTNDDGRFAIAVPTLPWQGVVKTIEDGGSSPRRAEVLVPVHLTATRWLDLGMVRVPAMAIGTSLAVEPTATVSLAVGDGLELTLKVSELSFPLGVEATDLAARRVPLDQLPKGNYGPGEIVAVYAFLPCGVTSGAKVSMRLPSTLPTGTAVNFRSIGLLDGVLSAPQSGKADGSSVATAAGAGLEELTWVVVSRP